MIDLAGICASLSALPSLPARPSPGSAATIGALPTVGRLPLLAALVQRDGGTLLLVVQSADAAGRAADDLRSWLGPARVLEFPASDALPYEHMSPGNTVVGRRLAVLQQLQTHRSAAEPLVLVTPLKALLQPTLTPDELQSALQPITVGSVVPPETLIQQLIERGYQRAATVEAPGEVTRRGAIVDVWPSADALPLRIEFFDDEVDSLRRFDPLTQRSAERATAAVIGPPHEYPLWQRSAAIARLAAVDLSDLRPESRAEWQDALRRLQDGERFEGRAFYAPFFRTTAAGLLDHLPHGALVVTADAGLLMQHALDGERQADEQRATLIASGELPAVMPQPLLRWSGLDLTAGGRAGLLDLTLNPFDHALSGPQFTPLESYGGRLRRLLDDVVAQTIAGRRVLAVTAQAARLQELYAERTAELTAPPAGSFVPLHGALDAGFALDELQLTLFTDTELFGVRRRRPPAERRKPRALGPEDRARFLRGLKVGDHVVHIEHGIAVFDGMIRRTVGEVEREYLVLQYAGGDRIYVPVDQVDRVNRYIGNGDVHPTLTRLGTQDWERAKRKARAAVQDLAGELLKLYAQRQTRAGHAFAADNEWQRELETSFPFVETDDQLRAIIDVKADMEQQVPMDRLICGDVGFGKTEVALRAAFKAVQDGKQVALLVPTTVLAQQHFDTFCRRMAAFPLTVEMLSRFRSAREQSAILEGVSKGRVDILIGTHRLLSKDVVFKDLGLLIVDEEQRFGVRHKERLKQLRAEVDVLTLTATPIPRTLHMALAGIRDMSVIDTPPEERIPIKTYVLPTDDGVIRDALQREIERGGQIYFVHNRVHSIYSIAAHLRELVPQARIGVGHGQMNEGELEQVMVRFFEGEYDVLVCTTIIESGLDVPNANTIIIDDAANYGLAQLYQLRGRVGRSANRAYAYLLYHTGRRMTPEAQARLEAIQEATELGAGFKVAMRDLEIRGAGNLLGAEQSGHIAAVGFDLYSRLLEQAVRGLKERFESGGDLQPAVPPPVSERVLIAPLITIDLPLNAYLPTEYVRDETLRLSVYQRMVDAEQIQEVRGLRQELIDRFGAPIPPPAQQLLFWLQVRLLALQGGVAAITTTNEEFVIRLANRDLQAARERIQRRFARDAAVRISPQSVRLDRRRLAEAWQDRLLAVVETLAGALA